MSWFFFLLMSQVALLRSISVRSHPNVVVLQDMLKPKDWDSWQSIGLVFMRNHSSLDKFLTKREQIEEVTFNAQTQNFERRFVPVAPVLELCFVFLTCLFRLQFTVGLILLYLCRCRLRTFVNASFNFC